MLDRKIAKAAIEELRRRIVSTNVPLTRVAKETDIEYERLRINLNRADMKLGLFIKLLDWLGISREEFMLRVFEEANEDLQARVTELQELISKMERLAELQNTAIQSLTKSNT